MRGCGSLLPTTSLSMPNLSACCIHHLVASSLSSSSVMPSLLRATSPPSPPSLGMRTTPLVRRPAALLASASLILLCSSSSRARTASAYLSFVRSLGHTRRTMYALASLPLLVATRKMRSAPYHRTTTGQALRMKTVWPLSSKHPMLSVSNKTTLSLPAPRMVVTLEEKWERSSDQGTPHESGTEPEMPSTRQYVRPEASHGHRLAM
mmetsp:Transcript_24642/g.59420  ORF Transcript_24642/g.59420 Transcript_24642/m.59420 type:complete len:207 (-) Transcript_24642:558-1178(-)